MTQIDRDRAAAPAPTKTPAGLLALAVPVMGLASLGIMAALYRFNYEWYLHLFYALGFVPYKFPFLDWDGVSAAIKCWHDGVDVYRVNPCDIMGRPHDYSPLWLRASFIPSGPSARNAIGVGSAICFFVSLTAVFRPQSWREVGIFAAATGSTMVVYLLERANIDLMIFILLAAAGVLGVGAVRGRLASYGLIIFAGLLKFYPLVIMLTALRERPKLFAILTALSLAIVSIAFLSYRNEVIAAVSLVPRGSFNSVFFGASNLPAGLAYVIATHQFPAYEQIYAPLASRGLQSALFAALFLAAALQALWAGRNAGLVQAYGQTPDREKLFLVIGALAMLGCFFAGQSIGYRGVFFVFVVTGLVAMGRGARGHAAGTMVRGSLLIILFIMWSDAINHWVMKLCGPSVQAVFWLVRELLWWQLATMLMAIIFIFASQSNMMLAARTWLTGANPAGLARD